MALGSGRACMMAISVAPRSRSTSCMRPQAQSPSRSLATQPRRLPQTAFRAFSDARASFHPAARGQRVSQPYRLLQSSTAHSSEQSSASFASTSPQPPSPPSPPPYDDLSSANFDDLGPEREILEAALLCVPQLGWTLEALSQGAVKAGYPGIAHGLFPRGAVELAEYFVARCNRELARKLPTMDLQRQTARHALHAAVKARLEMNAPYMSRWSQAMGLMATPPNTTRALHGMALLVDEIWAHCGDKSADVDWYSKRALLGGIYSATELFMLTDASPGFRDTWAFLERRIDDLGHLITFRAQAEEVGSLILGGIGYALRNAPVPLPSSPQHLASGLASFASSVLDSLLQFKRSAEPPSEPSAQTESTPPMPNPPSSPAATPASGSPIDPKFSPYSPPVISLRTPPPPPPPGSRIEGLATAVPEGYPATPVASDAATVQHPAALHEPPALHPSLRSTTTSDPVLPTPITPTAHGIHKPSDK